MKRKTQIAIISGLLTFSFIGAAASTIAWFNTVLTIDMNENVTGESNGAYFASGTGESNDPFIINSPVHLYNLAWLQYLGYFNNNRIGAESGPTYFAIDPSLSEPIDMTGWILPPIGTTLNPFVGVFNGNGKTIANLTTINSSNVADYPKKPYPVRQANVVSNVNVLGLFGVVGTCNLTGTGVTPIYPAAGYSANAINNFYIDNEHVVNYQSSTLAGIAAGYVNAPLSGVGISTSNTENPSSIDLSGTQNAPTVYGGKTNISDFTSIGFCEDTYKTEVLKEYTELYDPASSQALSGFVAQEAGDTQGWGGSIDMASAYDVVREAWDEYDTNNTYCPEFPDTITDKTGVYTYPANRTITRVDGVTTNDDFSNETRYTNGTYYNYFTTNRKNSSGKITAQYTLAHRSNSNSFMYLYGANDITVSNGTSETITTYTTQNATGYKISVTIGNTTYYLNRNGTDLATGTSSGTATEWYYEGGKFLSYDNSGNNTARYYLYYNNANVSLTTTAGSGSVFAYSNQYSSYYVTNGNDRMYLTYDTTQSKWLFGYEDNRMSQAYMTIYAGTNNYLTLNNTTVTRSGSAQATTNFSTDNYYWIVDDTYLSAYIDGTRQYLSYYNNAVVMRNDTTYAFTKYVRSTTETYYRFASSGGWYTTYYYLRYNSGWTVRNQRNSNDVVHIGNSSFAYASDYQKATFTSGSTSYQDKATSTNNVDYTIHTQSTYFPLKQDSNGVPLETNTGYIIGGANATNVRQGDMRISQYASSNIRDRSVSNNEVTLTHVYTYNGSVTEVTSNNYKTLFNNEESPYLTSKQSLEAVLSENTSNIYGLHFMDSEMLYGIANGIDQSVYAEYAMINGDEYNNYELPQNSIDFNLKDRGYINFIAGTYFPSNNCFFTISEIQRNSSTHAIVNIKNIRAIYKSSTNPSYSYIYGYSDGTYSKPYIFVAGEKFETDGVTPYVEYSTINQLPNGMGYSQVFNFDWIDSNLYDYIGFETDNNGNVTSYNTYYKNAFYFEIPMNSGEYCMGSPHFSGNTTASGAYLMYLDIGANATKAYRSTVLELLHTIAEEFSRPLGVGLVVAGATSVDDANSYCITIKSQYGGKVTFTRTNGTTATYTESVSSDSVYLSYTYDGLNINNSEAPQANTKVEQNIKRITYFDFSASDNSTTKTVLSMITTTTTNLGSSPTTVTTYDTKQYKKYTEATGGQEVAANLIRVYNDTGHLITTSDYANAAFFSDCGSLSTVSYKFTSVYTGAGTISAVINLTTNQQLTTTYTLYSARGYAVSIFLDTGVGDPTDITSRCTLIAKDNNTYVVDQQTGKILLVIHNEFILNDTSSQGD